MIRCCHCGTKQFNQDQFIKVHPWRVILNCDRCKSDNSIRYDDGRQHFIFELIIDREGELIKYVEIYTFVNANEVGISDNDAE